MAADEEKTTVENGGETPEEAAPKKGGKKGLLMMIIIGVACIGIGVGAAFMLKPGGDTAETTTESSAKGETAAKKSDKEKKAAKEKKKKKKKKEEGEGGGPILYAIKDIVVNPAGTGGSRFLSVSVGFELSDEEVAAEFEQREPLVRDALITILSSKTVAQLTDIKQKEIMRYQIKRRLEKLLDTDGIEAVYYTDFVLQ